MPSTQWGQPNCRHTGLHRVPPREVFLAVHDALAITLSWSIVRIVQAPDASSSSWGVAVGVVGTMVAAGLLFARRQGLYASRVTPLHLAEVASVARTSAVVGLVGLLASRNWGADVPWTCAVFEAVLCFVLLVGGRRAFDAELRSQRRAGEARHDALVVGNGPAVDEMLELLDRWPELGYRVVGVVGPFGTGGELPWLGDFGALRGAVAESGVDDVFIMGGALADEKVASEARDIAEAGVHVQLVPGVGSIDYRRLRPGAVGYEPLLELDPSPTRSLSHALKRPLDVALAGAVLLVAAPILLVAAVAIKLQDGGPVLFRQRRVGLDGRPFEILKLRTMVSDAESRLAALAGFNERAGGPLFKLDRDPRVTHVGRVLRATSIDELPQLVNVLRGEMSLVGPRPPLLSEYEAFDEELRERQHERPGITGLWQLEARDTPSFVAYRRLDLYYVRNWSLSLDLVILLLTAYAVVLRAREAVGGHLTSRRDHGARTSRWRPVRLITTALVVALLLFFTGNVLARALTLPGLDEVGSASAAVVVPPDADGLVDPLAADRTGTDRTLSFRDQRVSKVGGLPVELMTDDSGQLVVAPTTPWSIYSRLGGASTRAADRRGADRDSGDGMRSSERRRVSAMGSLDRLLTSSGTVLPGVTAPTVVAVAPVAAESVPVTSSSPSVATPTVTVPTVAVTSVSVTSVTVTTAAVTTVAVTTVAVPVTAPVSPGPTVTAAPVTVTATVTVSSATVTASTTATATVAPTATAVVASAGGGDSTSVVSSTVPAGGPS